MKNPTVLFWNVDTQRDFMNSDGKLYAPGAEEIKPVLRKLTLLAKEKDIQVINTADHHFPSSQELSQNPDFKNTFPQHCMAESSGALFIEETEPVEGYAEISWDKRYTIAELQKLLEMRNIIIRKDAFDVFKGNPNTNKIVEIIKPGKVFVYGVTTNVCVHHAVMGLAERKAEVYIIEDAIKELPNIPLPYDQWDNIGVVRISSDMIDEYL